ncbi:Sentrin-specific protease 7 [Fasciolopsis buskii]|uniref:Sentrin-specific protease 7 n=1 Tax=Fasciolopsis buskii TaxID=27845 RepID=A0A8E0S7A1_9TREM|nr:Sentrin-specific protease 7 [Fasciolopsis buski]
MKWIILVLGERMAHSPEKNVLVQQMELIGSSIRANDGFCKMNCTWMETRSLLLDCGLRLPRAESRAQAVESTKMQSTAASVTPEEQPNTSQPNGSSLTPDTAQPKSDVGLLNSVVNTLSSAGMHILESTENPTTLFSKKMSSSKVLESNYQDNKDEDLIILCEEENESEDDDGIKSGSKSPNPTTGSQDVADGGPHSHFKFDYQPPGSTDSVILTPADLDCLSPGAQINDAIINFYLKYLYFEQLSDLQRACAYVFNCFFYSRLAASAQTVPPANTRSQHTKPASDSVSSLPSASLARHANVAKWTRRVDLFCKDYIIIPINEASHWFLGLVCYPWMAGMVSYTALYQAAAFDMCQLTERFANIDSLVGHVNLDDRTMCSDPVERLPNDTVGSAFDRWRRQRLVWLRSRGINAMPCILLFDSLPCQTRVSNLHVIRDYLQAEWDTRRAMQDGPLCFNKDTIRGFSPRVPSQSNLVDCGIYLLHYVEMFFKQPVKSYTKDYFQHEMASWFTEATVGEKRMQIYSTIMRLHKRSQPDDQTV